MSKQQTVNWNNTENRDWYSRLRKNLKDDKIDECAFIHTFLYLLFEPVLWKSFFSGKIKFFLWEISQGSLKMLITSKGKCIISLTLHGVL